MPEKATQTEDEFLDLHIRPESRAACQKYAYGYYYESPDEDEKSDLTLSDWSDEWSTDEEIMITVRNFQNFISFRACNYFIHNNFYRL